MSGPLGSQQWMYASGGFYDHTIDNSLRFNDNDSAYLSRTPASAGNRKTFTYSAWFKRCELNDYHTIFDVESGGFFQIRFNNSNIINVHHYISGYQIQLDTVAVYRDVSAWYHIVVSVDTTQATASNRVKLYVNGEQITSFSTATYPSQNYDTLVNSTAEHCIGTHDRIYNYVDGYLADINFIDGQALDPTSFGETKSGIWIPKDTSGLTFGTNGFRLAFADSGAIGDDTSGNTNDWTANNLAVSDVVPDSPTNNFATMNPNDFALYLSEGNLKVSNSTGSGSIIARSTMLVPPNSGKWYFEGYNTVTSANGHYIGVWCPTGLNAAILSGYHDDANFGVLSGHECVTYLSNGTIRNNSSSSTVTGLDDFNTAGDIVGVLLDMDAQTVQFYNNGSAQGSAQSLPNTTDPYGFFVAGHFSKGVIFNFGQDSTFAGAVAAGGNTDANGLGDFKYAPLSGALSPCSANLPQGAIDTLNDETPEEYFNTVLWTGDATNPRTLTGVGFEPSFSWLKSRSQAFSHRLYDQIRGGGKVLFSDTTGAESGPDNGGDITAWTADGFTTSGALNNNNLNGSGYTYVGWNWKANGAGVSNTDGSITSTVSVGATSQQNWFSVVGYTGNATAGATIGHGLGVAPDMIIVKSRSNARDWRVYHSSLGSSYTMDLNTTLAVQGPNSAYWNSTDPTSSVFSVGSVTTVNGSGENYIAYCFANAEGLCKVGSYTGNGSTDGVFVNVGFRPSAIIAKNINDGTTNWWFHDNKRLGYNANNYALFPNLSFAEDANVRIDMLSNGFKLRNTAKHWNTSGQTFIYLAIAEQPFKYANAR